MKAPKDIYLFEDGLPGGTVDGFKSECPPDKKFKVENLFEFKRGRGDLAISAFFLGLALFFLIFFFTETGWDKRKLPQPFGTYLAHQLGLVEMEGRVPRFGRLLKQSWLIPMICLALLVPVAIWNFRASLRVYKWRQRFGLPTDMRYEFEKYGQALEYVGYFILYTLAVPILGYLLSTLILGTFLTWRLGYRSRKWIGIGFASSFAIVLVFRSFLQIKTPVSIWLYDQLPAALRGFMLTYF
ncbi:MAG: tripartite tricarboxylate transporter TctB family protein [Pseudomonadota bacterium]